MANKSGEPIDDYSGEYFQCSLQYIEDYAFQNKVFQPGPAIVKRYESVKETRPYSGEALDPDTEKLIPDGWDHDHCYVCGWRIEPGDSCWQNAGGVVLCDECHHFVSTDERHGRR